MRLFLFCFLSCQFLTSQAAKTSLKLIASVESFNHVMAYKEPTEEEIDTCLQVALKYIYNNIDTALLLSQQAVEWSEKLHNGTETHGKSLLFLGDAARANGQWELSEVNLLAGKAIYELSGNSDRVAWSFLKLGDLRIKTGDLEEAIDFNIEAMEIWESISDTNNLFRPYLGIGEIFYELDQPEKSIEYNRKAEAWAINRKADGILMHALGNIALNQQVIGNRYQAKADTSISQREIFQDSVRFYFESANSNLERSLPLARKSNSRRAVTTQLLTLINIKNELGDHELALELGEEMGVLAEEYGRLKFILGQKRAMAHTYRLMGEFKRALSMCNDFSRLEGLEEFPQEIKEIDREYYFTYKGLGQYQKALSYLERYREAEKKEAVVETNEVVAKAEAKYESSKKEQEIFALNVENASIQRQNNYLVIGSVLLGVFGFLAYQLSKLRRENKLKMEFAEALVFTEENERKRIARDLHDGIGQSLMMLKKQIDQNVGATDENRKLIASTLEEVRSVSHALHPILLEKFGVTATLSDTVNKFQDNYPEIFFTSEVENIDELVSEKVSLQIYRTVQEAFNNLVKHSGATAGKLTMKTGKKNILITVQDNGKGFDPDLMKNSSKSLGLKTMSERLASIKGSLTLKKQETGGMLVTLRVPISKQNLNAL